MAELIVMPKLGLTMKEGTIGKWFKNEGDKVERGEVLLEVTTDKLTNEVEANASGYLRKIIVAAGDSAECLKPIAIIGDKDEDISGLLASSDMSKGQDEAATERIVAVVEENPDSKISKDGGRVIAAPAAKKLAKELGINIEDVEGTGPKGRIIVKDVEDYKLKKESYKASPMAQKTADALDVDMAQIHKSGRIMKQDVIDFHASERVMTLAQPEDTRVPMDNMRKMIAKRMTESWHVSPAVTYDMKVDMSALIAFKENLKAIQKVTFTDLLIKIAATVLLEFPLVNATVDGNEIIIRNYVNIGVAVALEDGLIVPVVKYANVKGIKVISDEVKKLATKAKQNQLTSDELQGGTFTITNLGMFGMNAFSPIINQPEVAILGVNTIEETLVKIDGEIVSKPMMTLSLSADHRAVDGAVAANFLKRLKTYIECPEMLLL